MVLSNYASVTLGTSGSGGIFDTLSPFYQRAIADQWNREAKLLSLIMVESRGYGSSGIDFVTSRGVSRAKVITELQTLVASDGYVDSKYHGSLPYQKISSEMLMSFSAMSAASTGGQNTSPEMVDIRGRALLELSTELTKKLNDLLYTGTGSSDIQGLYASSSSGWLANTGTVAGLDKSDHTYFRPGGAAGFTQPSATGVALTTSLINKTRATIKKASGMNPDFAVFSPMAYVQAQELFDNTSVRRWQYSDMAGTVHDGGFEIAGMRCTEDISIDESDGYGKALFGNSRHMKLVFREPIVRPGKDIVVPLLHGSSVRDADILRIPLVVRELPLAADGEWLGAFLDCNLLVDRPQAHAWLANISI